MKPDGKFLLTIITFCCFMLLSDPSMADNCATYDKVWSSTICTSGITWASHDWWTAEKSFVATGIEVRSEVVTSGTWIRIRVNDTIVAQWFADVGMDIHTETITIEVHAGDSITYAHGGDSGCVTGPFQVKFCAPDGPVISTNPIALQENELLPGTSFAGPGSKCVGIAAAGDNLFITDNMDYKIYQTDLDGSVVYFFDVPAGTHRSPSCIEYHEGSLWLSDSGDELIYNLSTSGAILNSFTAPGEAASGIAFNGSILWHVDFYDDILYKLDTGGNILDQIAMDVSGQSYGDLSFDGTYLWLLREDIYKIYRIDFNGNQVGYSYDLPSSTISAISVDGETVWLADKSSNTIYRSGVPAPVPVGNSSTRSLTIQNNGNQYLSISALAVTGPDAQDFSIESNLCSGTGIPPEGTCTVDIVFTPSSAGASTATLMISSNDPTTPVKTVLIEGNTFDYLLSQEAPIPTITPVYNLLLH